MELVKGTRLQVCSGAGYALPATHRERFNADWMAFMKG
jgi:hypothetical protein